MAEKTHCLREQKCSLQAIKKASEITGTSARAFVLEKETPLPNEIKVNRHPFDRHFEIPLEHVNLCIEPVWIKMGLASHLGWDADKEANNFRVVITRLFRSYLDSQRICAELNGKVGTPNKLCGFLATWTATVDWFRKWLYESTYLLATFADKVFQNVHSTCSDYGRGIMKTSEDHANRFL